MLNWNVVETGGGCKAFEKVYSNGNYTRVTDESGTDLPKEGSILVGSYDSEGNELDVGSCDSKRQLTLLLDISEELYA